MNDSHPPGLPPLPAVDLKRQLPYEAIRYVAGFPETYVLDYAVAYARACLSKAPPPEQEAPRLSAAKAYAWRQSLEKGERLCRQHAHGGDAATLLEIADFIDALAAKAGKPRAAITRDSVLAVGKEVGLLTYLPNDNTYFQFEEHEAMSDKLVEFARRFAPRAAEPSRRERAAEPNVPTTLAELGLAPRAAESEPTDEPPEFWQFWNPHLSRWLTIDADLAEWHRKHTRDAKLRGPFKLSQESQAAPLVLPEPLTVTLLRELKFARGLLAGHQTRSDAIDEAIALAEQQGVMT